MTNDERIWIICDKYYNGDTCQAWALLYEWIKTGVFSRRDFTDCLRQMGMPT